MLICDGVGERVGVAMGPVVGIEAAIGTARFEGDEVMKENTKVGGGFAVCGDGVVCVVGTPPGGITQLKLDEAGIGMSTFGASTCRYMCRKLISNIERVIRAVSVEEADTCSTATPPKINRTHPHMIFLYRL
jgi:hypothetical protein